MGRMRKDSGIDHLISRFEKCDQEIAGEVLSVVQGGCLL